MTTYLKRTGQVCLGVTAIMAGAGMSIILYRGIIPEVLPGSPGYTDIQSSSKSVSEVFRNNEGMKPVLMFLVMLAGMFFNQIFENLKVQKESGMTQANILRLFADGFTGITFWMAFFVSPIIFYGTYYLVDKLPEGAVGYFYAFQGGFFWYNIFSRFELKSKK